MIWKTVIMTLLHISKGVTLSDMHCTYVHVVALFCVVGEASLRRGGAGRGKTARQGLPQRPHLLRRVQVRQARAQDGPLGVLRR